VLQERITAEGYLGPDGKKAVFKQVAVMNLLQAAVGVVVGLAGLPFVELRREVSLAKYFPTSVTTMIGSPIGCTCRFV
jgi:hypothetical protein